MSGLDSTERGFLLCIGTPALLLAGFGSAAKFSIGERRTGCWLAGFAVVALVIVVIAVRSWSGDGR